MMLLLSLLLLSLTFVLLTNDNAGDVAVFVGGNMVSYYYGDAYSSSAIDLFNASNNQWSSLSLLTPRSQPGVVALNDSVVMVMGGALNTTDLKSVEFINVHTMTVTPGPDMPLRWTDISVGKTSHGKILVAGNPTSSGIGPR